MLTKATHILTWLPPDCWELRETAPREALERWTAESVDEDPAELTEWVSDFLGVPVHLGIRQETRVRVHLLRRTVPFYYVFPGTR